MRALTYESPGVVTWRDVPEPTCPPDGALVRPLAVARCDLDLPMAVAGLFPGPFMVGHEFVAEVVALGDRPVTDSNAVALGDRVCVPFQVSCVACPTCRAGRPSACTVYRAPAGAAYGFGERGGGHGGAVSDLVAVPHAAHLLVPAPPGPRDAVLATVPDNVLDAHRAVAGPLSARPGGDVLVLAGAVPSIGLYAVLLSSILGAGSVRYVDDDAERCAAAAGLGADVIHREGDWPRYYERADVVVDGTAHAAGMVTAVRSTADQGHLTVVGIQFGDVALPLLEMYTRGITVHVSRADSRADLPAVLELVASDTLDPLAVPTVIAPFDEADRSWLSPATKLVLTRE